MTPSANAQIKCGARPGRQPGHRGHARLVRISALALCAAAAIVGVPGASAQSGDAGSGRSLAATCAGCHGPGGVSAGEVASLAGKPREEIVRTMREFKTGARPATVMQQLAKGYTEDQVELLARWFAAQKPVQ